MTVEQAEMLSDEMRPGAHALRTGMTIAAAIGLHNFAEGLAIGVSASTGEIGLATVLIIGFAVHNATEGFGIVGPARRRPAQLEVARRWPAWSAVARSSSARWSATTSAPSRSSCSSTRSPAGAILYVIGEVWTAMRRLGHRELGLLMLSAGRDARRDDRAGHRIRRRLGRRLRSDGEDIATHIAGLTAAGLMAKPST